MATYMQTEIRKLRKKLRQIEILERQDRNLNEVEKEKVSRKEILRHELLDLLAQYPEEYTPPDDEVEDDCEVKPPPQCDDKVGTLLIKNSSEVSLQFDELAMKRSRKSSGSQQPTEVAPKKKSKQEPQESTSSTSHTDNQSLRETHQEVTVTKLKELRQSWEKVSFLVRSLEGHNDLVTCAAIDKTLLVTGSRDTTIKLWNADTGIEEQSLRGHTAAIICLILLSEDDSKSLCAGYSLYDNSRIIISGSQDCCVIVWSSKGTQIKSMYTYNAVVSVGYLPQVQLIVAGSESGKLEVWDPLSGMNLQSFKAYEDPVSCIKVFENEVVTSGGDGVIKIWHLYLKHLRLSVESNMIPSANGHYVVQRYIRCLARTKSKVYYGDDGVNIKAWNIKRGVVFKLRNHPGEFGTTDTICTTDDLMISTSYNMDSGYSLLNVRFLPNEQYVTSLDDENTHRIMALVATNKEPDLLRLVTAGQELKVWTMIRKRPVPKEETESLVVVEPHSIANFIQAASDSDSDIYSDDSESEDDDETQFDVDERTFYQRWCSIL